MRPMDEILKELDEAYKAISSIPVAGDAVDAMAVARAHLRKAYTELKQIKSEEEKENE